MKCSRNLNPQFVSPAPSVTPAHAVRPGRPVSTLNKGCVAESQWTQGTWMSWMEIWLYCGDGGGGKRVPSDKWCNSANTPRISSLTQRCVHLITASYFPPCLARQPPARSSHRHLADAPTLLRPTLAPFYCPPAANATAVCHVGQMDDFSWPTLTSETNQISAGP